MTSDVPAQRLLVVDEAEVGGLTGEARRLTGLHTGLALLRHQQPEGAEGGPDGGRGYAG